MSLDSHILYAILLAFLSSILPTFVWLYFWTREDSENPEPKSMIALAFLGGMVSVFISLILEKYFFEIGLIRIFDVPILNKILLLFENISLQTGVELNKILLVIVLAPLVEEIIKFVTAYILVLRSKYDDEPLDPMIYMITTALGFTAIENTLFLITPFINNNIILSIYTGNLRFIGATLLHTISSATVAIFVSFHFFDNRIKKVFFVIFGLICSITIHGIFNYLMVGNQASATLALELIWIIVIILLLAFEKIKKIRREQIN